MNSTKLVTSHKHMMTTFHLSIFCMITLCAIPGRYDPPFQYSTPHHRTRCTIVLGAKSIYKYSITYNDGHKYECHGYVTRPEFLCPHYHIFENQVPLLSTSFSNKSKKENMNAQNKIHFHFTFDLFVSTVQLFKAACVRFSSRL